MNIFSEKKNILIVEDEQTMRTLYQRVLTMQGYVTTAVYSGEEGLVEYENKYFDLIICDLGLPGISGWDFVKKIRFKNKNTPILIITGWNDALSEKTTEKHQVQKTLLKPIQLDQFVKYVHELVYGAN